MNVDILELFGKKLDKGLDGGEGIFDLMGKPG